MSSHTVQRARRQAPEETLLHVFTMSKSPVFQRYRIAVFNVVAIRMDVFYYYIAVSSATTPNSEQSETFTKLSIRARWEK